MVPAARTRLIGQALSNTEIAVHLNVEPKAIVNLRRPTPIHASALQSASTNCSPSDPFWQQQLSVTTPSLSHGSRLHITGSSAYSTMSSRVIARSH